MPERTEQQKIYLTREARARLRREAAARDMQMSEIAEHLILRGEYPPAGAPHNET